MHVFLPILQLRYYLSCLVYIASTLMSLYVFSNAFLHARVSDNLGVAHRVHMPDASTHIAYASVTADYACTGGCYLVTRLDKAFGFVTRWLLLSAFHLIPLSVS
jgi:hypothetical protein